MPTFDSFDGVRLHYEVSGSGAPVVLLHSFPFDSRVWTGTGVLPALVAADERVSRWTVAGTASPTSRTTLLPMATMRQPTTSPASSITSACHRLTSSHTPSAQHVGLRVLQDEPRNTIGPCSAALARAYLNGTKPELSAWHGSSRQRMPPSSTRAGGR